MGSAPVVLGLEERNLLSVAYKNVVGARRASLRIIISIEQREKQKDSQEWKVMAIKQYKMKVEEELTKICNDILELLENKLIGSAEEAEPAVFYRKMQADYYRYLAEFASEEMKTDYAIKAKKAYTDASESANELNSTHPIRLGLALNYSVFLYEVDSNQERLARWPRRHSTAPSPSWTRSTRKATRTRRSSCSCCETTSRCGRPPTTKAEPSILLT